MKKLWKIMKNYEKDYEERLLKKIMKRDYEKR